MLFAQLTGPYTEFEGVDGKTYRLSPIGFKESAEYLIWLQFKPWELFKATCKGLPPEDVKEMGKSIYKECFERKLSITSKEVLESFSTLDGIAEQIYLSLRMCHPELSRNDISKIVTPGNYEEIMNKLDIISGMVPENKETDEILGE